MKSRQKHAALYIYGERCDALRQAEVYCEEHSYVLEEERIYQDIEEPRVALRWLCDAMEDLAFSLLLVSSLHHISANVGQILNFLQEAQECQVEVVCLEPEPRRLSELELVIAPFDRERSVGTERANLTDVVWLLRTR